MIQAREKTASALVSLVSAGVMSFRLSHSSQYGIWPRNPAYKASISSQRNHPQLQMHENVSIAVIGG